MKRIFVYLLISFIFSGFDVWYATETVTLFTKFGPFALLLLVYLFVACIVWLIPIIPMCIYEVKRKNNTFRISLITFFIWISSLFFYYGFWIPFKVVFIGQKTLIYLHISNHNSPYYWESIINFTSGSLEGFTFWAIFAIIPSFIVTYVIVYIIKKIKI